MGKTQQDFAVLFADVAGSTQIYEKFGDSRASRIINNALALMTDITRQHSGTLIKTIGDEVMCRFDDINHAVETACQISEALDKIPPNIEIPITVRIGIHWGPALLQDDGDLFGDVVNVAARMTSIAQARQIITTEDAYSQLYNELKLKCREFDRTEVKGKASPMKVYEVVWEPQDVTRLSTAVNLQNDSMHVKSLELIYQDFHNVMTSESDSILLGRSEQCDIVIDSPLASRSHAVVKLNRGKYILCDQSTNGTHVRFDSGKSFYLRRENLPITENGVFSLGEQLTPNNSHLIYFKVL